MKNKIITVAKTILAIIIDAVLLYLAFLFSLMSPYEYEWDATLKRVEPDKVLFLILIWLFIGILTALATIFKNKTNIHVFKHEKANVVSLAFGGVLLCYCVVYIIWLSGMYQG